MTLLHAVQHVGHSEYAIRAGFDCAASNRGYLVVTGDMIV